MNPLVIKPIVDLGVNLTLGKKIELKEVLLGTITALSPFSELANKTFDCWTEFSVVKNLGLQEVVGAEHNALRRQFIDLNQSSTLNDVATTNQDRIKQGFSPIEALSGNELLVFKNHKNGTVIELTQQELSANFNLGNYNALNIQSTQFYWQNRLADINTLNLDALRSECAKLEIIIKESDDRISGVKDGIEVLRMEKGTKSGWAQVGIKSKGRTPFLSGIKPGQFSGNIEYRYEVRGNFYDKIGGNITLQRKNGTSVDIPIVRKKELMHGMTVWYNVPDFDKFALATVEIPEQIINLNAQEHKRYAIKELALMFYDGKVKKGAFSPEIEDKLVRIHASTINGPTCLRGYEIHHDGNGRMQFIPNDIHCRKSSHLSGSWLMNHKNYGLDALCKTGNSLDEDFYSIHLPVEISSNQRPSAIQQSFSHVDLEQYITGTINERKKVILSLSDRIQKAMYLKNISLIFKPLERNTCGHYNNKLRQITINEYLLDSGLNYEEVVNTTLYEIRHAIQHDAICDPAKYGLPKPMIAQWRKDIEHYISPEFDLEAYAKQSIEIDANEWANHYTPLLIA